MTRRPAKSIWCERILLEDGWAERVRLDLDSSGIVTRVEPSADPSAGERIGGIVIPGMTNLHCHAFQRAMAGLAERAGADTSNFWSWREAMYALVKHLTPDQIEAIAAQLYVEMLKAGYTAVAEFHYLHNAPDGKPYYHKAELARRILSASDATGIRLTLLPVLYRSAGFGGVPIGDEQKRFGLSVDDWLELTTSPVADSTRQRCAGALHSLRAVPEKDLSGAVDSFFDRHPGAPLHIHVAEQEKEVADCLAWSGARPVEWLLDHCDVDHRWVLVHATHMTDAETERAAASGATAGLCPTTEANLGDGLFQLSAWLEAKGNLGIGSDSNVSVDPFEELRWLEYGQRLVAKRRAVSASEPGQSTGTSLWRTALGGGARALGQPVGGIAVGKAADLVVLDPDHPSLVGRSNEDLTDAMVFANVGTPIREVWVAGQRLVNDRRHEDEDRIAAAFRASMIELAHTA